MDTISSGNENVTPNPNPQPPTSNTEQTTTNSSSNPAQTSTAVTFSLRSKPKTDPAWAYVAHKKEGTQNVYICLCCNNIYRGGGINRMKHHLAGIAGNIAACKKVPADVRHRIAEALSETAKKKSVEDIGEEGDEVEHVSRPPISESLAKKRKGPGTMDKFFAPRTTPGAQPSLKSVLASKEAQHTVKMLIAEWAIVNCIPFRAVECPLFQKAIDGICSIGPGFKAPTAYDFKTNLLREWKDECQLLINSHRAKWKDNGCTLMADGWTDVRQRTLINFLVYSTHGMVYVKSVDASDLVKDARTLFTLFCEVIEWVGPKNIVHVVTDNLANYVACGRLIKEKYKNIYWSPCAAHCLNLTLKDISSMPHVAEIASKVSKITVFAYNHMVFLSWLRKRPNWKEIVRPGPTRFATTFITLHNIYMHKQDLQALVVDPHFIDHRLSRTDAGRMFSAIILDSRFWIECHQIVKIVVPLVKLLRIVDSDVKPSLPYVYDGMQRAKNGIKEMFKGNQDKYQPYTSIIKAGWDKHLKANLHAASYLLNPAFAYGPTFVNKGRLMQALLDVMEANSEETVDFLKVMKQVTLYIEGKESFSRETCKLAAQKLDPYEWWMYYGYSVPELQRVAKRILSQTSSSSGCERNWSLFERIHTKRKNRLKHQMLNDLVFKNYNLRLKHRSTLKKAAASSDPIDFESIDEIDFWVTDEDPTPEFSGEDVEDLQGLVATASEGIASAPPLDQAIEGDEDMDIPEPLALNEYDHLTTSSALPNQASDDLSPADLDIGLDDY